MLGTLLYGFGSGGLHSKLTKEMHITLRSMLMKTLFVIDVSINWAIERNWQTKILDSWKVSQLNVLTQERVNAVLADLPHVTQLCALCSFEGDGWLGVKH